MKSTAEPILRDFERCVRQRPDAVLVASQRRRCTRSELDGLARGVQRRLLDAGLEPGGTLALRAANGPAFLAGLLGAWRAGLTALLIDPGTPDAECGRIARRIGAQGVLGSTTPWPADPADFTVHRLDSAQPCRLAGIAVIKLSSGSCAGARGVAAAAESLMADDDALTSSMGLEQDDVFLATIPLAHSYGLSSIVMPALRRGVRVVVPEQAGGPFAPLEAARELEATVLPTVPAYLSAVVRLSEVPPLTPSLRRIVSAGAPLDPEIAKAFRERFGRRIHVFYGASECGGICYDREGFAAEFGTLGSPIDGVELELEPLGDGPARVVVRSPAVAAGYVPEAHANLEQGRFRTEDLASWRGGELLLHGRLGDVINVKGKKVNPREVEQVLGDLESVREVHVMGVPSAGSGGQMVRAVIACEAGSVGVAEVRDWCRQRLAVHKVPRSVLFVDALPRTERGKLDRGALSRIAAPRTVPRGG